MMLWRWFGVAFGVAESPEGDSWYACPAGGYFSMKKSNQKPLGEDPETPTRRYIPPGKPKDGFPERD